MRNTKFTRTLCLILAMMTLVSGFVVSAGASGNRKYENATDKSISDYADKLNTISYEEYMAVPEHQKLFSGDKKPVSITIDFDACSNWSFRNGSGDVITYIDGNWLLTRKSDGKIFTFEEALKEGYQKKDLVYVDENVDGVKALYTPSLGTTTWTIDLASYGVTESALFNIGLEYYPVEGKSVAIEREFYINSEAPFAEARALTLAKIWGLRATDGVSELICKYELTKDDNLDSILEEAAEAGVEVVEVAEDGKSVSLKQPKIINAKVNAFVDKYELRFFTVDKNKNEMRPSMVQDPCWTYYTMHDSNGYFSEDFGFVLTPDANGDVRLMLEGINEPMAISRIVLTPYAEMISYEEYIASIKNKVGDDEGDDVVKIETEYPTNTSTNTVYPIEDRTSPLTSPVDPARTILNTIGSEKWATAGQWVEYQFTVNDSGLYDIYARFQQSYLDGMYVNRVMKLYTNYADIAAYKAAIGNDAGYYNGVPFAEAARLRYNYSSGWQVTGLNSGEGEDYKIYLEKDVVYTIRFEVTLGSMSELVREIEDILNTLNNDYLSILKLTGTSPDKNRDYAFNRLLPDTMMSMMDQAVRLEKVSAELKNTSGDASTYTGICDKLVALLRRMATDEDQVAKNLTNFKNYVGSLGTFLTDAKTQPLEMDYFVIQSSEKEQPKGAAGFFRSLWHEILCFIQSFFRDYNHMGAMEDSDTDKTISVWVPYGRDQANVIRNLSTNQFTADTKIAVDLKLVTGGTLLPSILAGMGPDVYMGLAQASVINYAIRGALINVEEMDGFGEVVKNFNDAAMVVLGTQDADGVTHYYGLPENQEFAMMFVRIDILASPAVDIEIPTTWEELYVAQSKLETNNMEIGVTTSYKMHLYQMGGELFADDGMRINLDSVVGLKSFETMCNMFTQFSFPYKYDPANRFRTGEMPIIISNYTSLYNKLKVFATEIEGSWTMVPVPGYEYQDENGEYYLNNQSVANVDATVMIAGVDDESAAWEYIKWYTGAACQVDYANEMVAIIGDSAKHPTANRAALESMPWTPDEYVEIQKQFENLASVPNYPGYYIIDRYTDFAFLSAYNDDADPSDEILSYINTINKEITRKREEFKLETLEIGQTKAEKRRGQVLKAMTALDSINGSKYEAAIEAAKYAIANDDIVQLSAIAETFSAFLSYDYLADKRVIENEDLSAAAKSAKIEQFNKELRNKYENEFFVFVTKQTAEPKNGGYKIEDLNEKQLVFFISVCLDDIAKALASY